MICVAALTCSMNSGCIFYNNVHSDQPGSTTSEGINDYEDNVKDVAHLQNKSLDALFEGWLCLLFIDALVTAG